MSASVQIILNERELAELKRLNRNLASQSVTLGGKSKNEFHMFYAGFCMALSQLGLDQVVNITEDEVLGSLLRTYRNSNDPCDKNISLIVKALGYSEIYDDAGRVTGFCSDSGDDECSR